MRDTSLECDFLLSYIATIGRWGGTLALMEASKQRDADPFDVLCNVAFSAPLRTRRERAERLRQDSKGFFERYSEPAWQVLNEILQKYIEYGIAEFRIPDILKVPRISQRGTVLEIAALFSGAENLRGAVSEMQTLLYS